MKSYFQTYGKWLPMIAICMLSSAFFSCSSDDWEPREVPEDYKPVFKEGKTWTYAYRIIENGPDLESSYSYVISGDTAIKGHNYLKLYRMDEKMYGDMEQHYYAAVREESLRAFYILKGGKKEKLLFDFGAKEAERFESGMLPSHYIQIIDEIKPRDFLGTPRTTLEWSIIGKEDGIGILECYRWYEGIGNNPDIFNQHFRGHYLISCYEDGRCIYDRELLPFLI